MEMITLDDSSPFIRFDDTWTTAVSTSITGDIQSDALETQYYNLTWHHTTADGARAAISWWGKDIVIYGALRLNHAWYAVSLDGQPKEYHNGYATTEVCQVPIYQTTNLTEGPHTAILTNEPLYNNTGQYVQYVDVDFITLHGQPLLPDAQGNIPTDRPPALAVSSPTSAPATSATSAVTSTFTTGSDSAATTPSRSFLTSSSMSTNSVSPSASSTGSVRESVAQDKPANALNAGPIQFSGAPNLHPLPTTGLVAGSMYLQSSDTNISTQRGSTALIFLAWLLVFAFLH